VEEPSKLPFTFKGARAEPLTPDKLPPANVGRWVPRRKAEVVAAVRAGVLTLEQACARYDLSHEEFESWERALDVHGVRGLRTTRRASICPRVAVADE
jgi:hypothetical protein